MTHAIFELESCDKLPLWAQVLMASRLIRRALLALPAKGSESCRAVLLAGCDGLERCAKAGQHLRSEQPAIKRAASFQPSTHTHMVAVAMHWAADAALAAEAALDFGAAESACSNSAWNAMTHASQSPGMTPLQARIYAAADLDLLRFACEESRIGRYDGLGDAVLQRLVPVHAPTGVVDEPAPSPEDLAR
jgi:hypothetical protein